MVVVVVMMAMMMMMMMMIIIIIIIIISIVRVQIARGSVSSESMRCKSRSSPYLVQNSVEIRYRCAHFCRSGTTVLTFSPFLRKFVCIVSDLTHNNDEL